MTTFRIQLKTNYDELKKKKKLYSIFLQKVGVKVNESKIPHMTSVFEEPFHLRQTPYACGRDTYKQLVTSLDPWDRDRRNRAADSTVKYIYILIKFSHKSQLPRLFFEFHKYSIATNLEI